MGEQAAGRITLLLSGEGYNVVTGGGFLLAAPDEEPDVLLDLGGARPIRLQQRVLVSADSF